jgi:hypothetical protein
MNTVQSGSDELIAAVRRRTERQLALRKVVLGEPRDWRTIFLHVELARLIAAKDHSLGRGPR